MLNALKRILVVVSRRLSLSLLALLAACGSLSSLGDTPNVGTRTASSVSDRYPGFRLVYVSPPLLTEPRVADGSIRHPFLSISDGLAEAIRLRATAQASAVVLLPGTYRESVVGDYYDDPGGATIAVVAAEPDAAIVSGGDPISDWSCNHLCTSRSSHALSISTNPWPQAPIGPLGLRREVLLAGQDRWAQVSTELQVQSTPHSFYVEPATGKIVASGADSLAAASISVRPILWQTAGLDDLVIDGIRFELAASPMGHAAVYIVDERHVLLKDISVGQNSWDGLKITGTDVTVVDSNFSSNGGSGVSAFQAIRVTLDGNVTSGNNWRGASGDYVDWSVGQKFMHVHDLRIRHHVSEGNSSRGLWLDTDVEDAIIEDSTFCGNLTDGIFVENVPGPVSLRSLRLCNNGRAGLLTSAANGLTLYGNRISGNRMAQLLVSGDFGRSSVDFTSGVTQILDNGNWSVTHNVLEAGPGQLLIGTTHPLSKWRELMATSLLDAASYEAAEARAFEVPGTGTVSFAEWQRWSGQDAHSSMRVTDGIDVLARAKTR